MGCIYYGAAWVGLALTRLPFPLSSLWLPNALLFAALLIAPVRLWWALFIGSFAGHLLAQLQGAIPLVLVLGWFAGNAAEALIGALLLRRLTRASPSLMTLREVLLFCTCAVAASLASSFLDAGVVRLAGWGTADYWTLWRFRFVSNLLAALMVVPVVTTLAAARWADWRKAGTLRIAEGAVLLAGLLGTSAAAFNSSGTIPGFSVSLQYLPMPFFLWAALRFGPALTNAALAIAAGLAIWGAGNGRGPFPATVTHDQGLLLQLYLITIAVPILLLGATMNDRKRAAQELRASEGLFAGAFRASPDAIAISSGPDGRVVKANDRWRLLLGHVHDSGSPNIGTPLAAHLEAVDRKNLLDRMRDDPDSVRDIEVTLHDRLRMPHQMLVSVIDVAGQDVPCRLNIARDISDQRLAETDAREQRHQLAHLMRIASLTDFSSALAHELNQPLTAVLSNAQAALRLIARDRPNIAEIRAILAEIATAGKRASSLIHHLRLLTRKSEEEFTRIDLNYLVQEVLDFARGDFAMRDVDVSASFSSELPLVEGDRVQIQQLVLNLVSNACEAMQDIQGQRLLSLTTMQGNDAVRLTVSDSGAGVPPADLERIFDPFFTTKESGLGLGLSICRKIARAHGGTLSAENRGRLGLSLLLVLPAAGGSPPRG